MNALKKIIILIVASFILTTLVSCSKSSKLDLDLQSIEGYVLDVAYNDRTDIFYILKQDELSAYKGDQEIKNIELSIEKGVITCYKKDVYVLDCESDTLNVYDKNLELKDTIKNDFECRYIVDLEITDDRIVYLLSTFIFGESSIYITDIKGKNTEEIDLPGGCVNLFKNKKDNIMVFGSLAGGNMIYEVSHITYEIVSEKALPSLSIEDIIYDSKEDCYYLMNQFTMYRYDDTKQSKLEPVTNIKNIIDIFGDCSNTESIVVGNNIYLVSYGELKCFNEDEQEELNWISIFGFEENHIVQAIEDLSQKNTDCMFYFNSMSYDNGVGYQKLFIDLASESSEYDIYLVCDAPSYAVYRDKINFNSLKKQGYMMDLSESKVLKDYTDMMLPEIKESCYYNGKLVRIPITSNQLIMITVDFSAKKMTWEDIAEKDLSLLNTDYFIAGVYSLERYENAIMGQYMINFRDELGHVDFMTKEFSTLLDCIKKTNESNFAFINGEHEEITSTYQLKLSDPYIECYNPALKADDVFPIPSYNDKTNLRTPVAIRYLSINPNCENKEIAIKLLEKITDYICKDEYIANIFFEDVERYVDLLDTDKQKELIRHMHNIFINSSPYVDSSFIAYAVNELFPIYKEGAMSKEEFTEYFIEKYEMWYKEQR